MRRLYSDEELAKPSTAPHSAFDASCEYAGGSFAPAWASHGTARVQECTWFEERECHYRLHASNLSGDPTSASVERRIVEEPAIVTVQGGEFPLLGQRD